MKLYSFEKIDNGGDQYNKGVDNGQVGALGGNCGYFTA